MPSDYSPPRFDWSTGYLRVLRTCLRCGAEAGWWGTVLTREGVLFDRSDERTAAAILTNLLEMKCHCDAPEA